MLNFREVQILLLVAITRCFITGEIFIFYIFSLGYEISFLPMCVANSVSIGLFLVLKRVRSTAITAVFETYNNLETVN